MLLQCTPGGFERFVERLGTPLAETVRPPDMAKLLATAADFGIDILGPLPEEPAEIASSSAGSGDLKGLNRQWIEAFNERNWKTERAVRSEDFRAVLSGMPEPLGNEAWSGFMQEFTKAFPDSRIQIEDCIAEGDRVVTRWALTGTHREGFQGVPASGKAVRVNGIEFNRVVDGKFVEHASQFDLAGLMRQISG
ncbi:MAG: ester cyclase [Terracidiphilus sp.]